MLQPTKIFLTCIITSCSCLFLGLLVAKPSQWRRMCMFERWTNVSPLCKQTTTWTLHVTATMPLCTWHGYYSLQLCIYYVSNKIYLLISLTHLTNTNHNILVFLYLVPTAKDILYQRFSKSEEQPVTFEEVRVLSLSLSLSLHDYAISPCVDV